MAGQFLFPQTNCVAIYSTELCSFSRFHPWMNFLNGQTNVRYALLASPDLNMNAIRTLYCSAINTTQNGNLSLSFRVRENTYSVTTDDVNRILHFNRADHVDPPNEDTIRNFFDVIHYDGRRPLPLGRLKRNNLPGEWNFFFETISRVFAARTVGFNCISSLLQSIGYAVAHNLNINYGELILNELLTKLGRPETRTLQSSDIQCMYPRFIQLFLNDILSEDDKRYFSTSHVLPPFVMAPNIFSYIHNRGKFADVPVVLTLFMQARFYKPPLPDNAFINEQGEVVTIEQEQPLHVEEQAHNEIVDEQEPPHLGEAGNLDDLDDLDDFFEKLRTFKPPVAIGYDNEPENQQVLSPLIEPNTQTLSHPPLLPLKRKLAIFAERKGVSAFSALNKDVYVVHPAALPPTKWRCIEHEETASPFVSSQLDIELIEENAQILESSSQNDESIEIGPSAKASCNESNTELSTISILQAMLNLNAEISSALQGETHTQDELMAATVLSSILRNDRMVDDSDMNQVPSQASEGNLGSLPINRPLSTLPEGTSLDPERDVPPTEGGRQLIFDEVGDLRNPIAPPVTSLEGATVISLAGTSIAGSSEGMRETLIELVSDTQNPKPSENRENSHALEEPVSEEPTLPKTTPQISQAQFDELSQRVTTLEAEVQTIKQSIVEVKGVQYDMIQEDRDNMSLLNRKLDDFIKSMLPPGSSSQSTPALNVEDNTTKGEKERRQEKGVVTEAEKVK